MTNSTHLRKWVKLYFPKIIRCDISNWTVSTINFIQNFHETQYILFDRTTWPESKANFVTECLTAKWPSGTEKTIPDRPNPDWRTESGSREPSGWVAPTATLASSTFPPRTRKSFSTESSSTEDRWTPETKMIRRESSFSRKSGCSIIKIDRRKSGKEGRFHELRIYYDSCINWIANFCMLF